MQVHERTPKRLELQAHAAGKFEEKRAKRKGLSKKERKERKREVERRRLEEASRMTHSQNAQTIQVLIPRKRTDFG